MQSFNTFVFLFFTESAKKLYLLPRSLERQQKIKFQCLDLIAENIHLVKTMLNCFYMILWLGAQDKPCPLLCSSQTKQNTHLLRYFNFIFLKDGELFVKRRYSCFYFGQILLKVFKQIQTFTEFIEIFRASLKSRRNDSIRISSSLI